MLSEDEKNWLTSRTKRLENYCWLKTGLFAILAVYGLADFAGAGMLVRVAYIIIWLVLAFYIYFTIDTKKYTRKVLNLIKGRSNQ